MKTFYPGEEIVFTTDIRGYAANITKIAADSIFLVQYQIRKIPTTAGSVILDTAARYHFAVHYRDIRSFERERKGFDWAGSGYALLGGGVLITAVGLGTWIFSEPDTKYYARPELVITAAALAGAGYFLTTTGNKRIILGKKYSLHYVHTK